MFSRDCDSHSSGGMGFVGIAIFLLILFAVFARGAHGFGGNSDCNTGFRGVGPADFWAANGLAQAVPGFQAQNFTQQAVNFGETISTINQGNWSLSKQVSDEAAAGRLALAASEAQGLRDQLYKAEARLMQQETINVISKQICDAQSVNAAEFCNIKSNMLTRPRVEPLVGLPELGCTNGNFGRRLAGLGDCGCA